MDASMAAAMGAAIGALGGLGGGWLALLGQGCQQQKQRETERGRWRDELRRDAYSACIASTKQLSVAWWKFADRVRKDGSDEEEWRVGFAEAHDAWVRFSEAVAAVSVAGPRTVVEAADTLRGAMYDLEVVGMDWFGAALREGHEHLGGWEKRLKQAAEAKREPDRAFQKAAREALGTERP